MRSYAIQEEQCVQCGYVFSVFQDQTENSITRGIEANNDSRDRVRFRRDRRDSTHAFHKRTLYSDGRMRVVYHRGTVRDDRVYVDFALRVNRAKAMARIQTIASNERHKYRIPVRLGNC